MACDFGKVLVCGLGRSTGSAARWLAAHLGGEAGDGFEVDSLTVYAGPETEQSKDAARVLEEAGAEVVFGSEDVQGSYDLAVKSPGISVFSAFNESAAKASREVICEPELAYRISPERWIGVTGTNGKTTTTTLVAAIFEAAGIRAQACGNIGLPCMDAAAGREEGGYVVAELSSFQLASMSSFAPDAAILLNITPDHVEWHGTLEHYAESKKHIFQSQTPDQFAIIDCTAPNTRKIAVDLMRAGHSVIAVGGPEGLQQDYLPVDEFGGDIEELCSKCDCEHFGSAYERDGRLCVDIDGDVHELVMTRDLSIAGEHNLQNALAASAAAVACGVGDCAVMRGLISYKPMEHRVEPCGEVDGVRFFDDSKATNTDAAAKALTAFEAGHVVMLLGGHDKGTDLSDLVRDCLSRCKAVVCYGEAGERFHSAFEDAMGKLGNADEPDFQLLLAPHMAEALDAAVHVAEPGDVVLLSPACSSFDEFGSFVERGNAFKAMVADLGGNR